MRIVDCALLFVRQQNKTRYQSFTMSKASGYETKSDRDDSISPTPTTTSEGSSSPTDSKNTKNNKTKSTFAESPEDIFDVFSSHDHAWVKGAKRKPLPPKKRVPFTLGQVLCLGAIPLIVLACIVVGVWTGQNSKNSNGDSDITTPPLASTLAPSGLRGGESDGNGDVFDTKPTTGNDDDIRCGCTSCTTTALATLDANGDTCGNRLDHEMLQAMGLTETEACSIVATRYPLTCGPVCHPEKCDGQGPPLCGCDSCTEEVWNTVVDGFSCGTRILLSRDDTNTENDILINEMKSCQVVAEAFPEECGACHPLACQR